MIKKDNEIHLNVFKTGVIDYEKVEEDVHEFLYSLKDQLKRQKIWIPKKNWFPLVAKAF
jgi:hypothetical protein